MSADLAADQVRESPLAATVVEWQTCWVAIGETIVAAGAGLIGAAIGAWTTSNATRHSHWIAESTAARAELAALYELIWANYGERRTRLALLRYRLASLGVDPTLLAKLMTAIEKCTTEIDKMRQLVREGLVDEEDAGVASRLFEEALGVADEVATALSTRPRRSPR